LNTLSNFDRNQLEKALKRLNRLHGAVLDEHLKYQADRYGLTIDETRQVLNGLADDKPRPGNLT
jgi:hypothetical protein